MLLCGIVVVPACFMFMVTMVVMGMVMLWASVLVVIVSTRRMVVVIVAVGVTDMRGRSRRLGLHAARSVAKLGHTLLDLGGFGFRLVEDQRQRLIGDGQGNPRDAW